MWRWSGNVNTLGDSAYLFEIQTEPWEAEMRSPQTPKTWVVWLASYQFPGDVKSESHVPGHDSTAVRHWVRGRSSCCGQRPEQPEYYDRAQGCRWFVTRFRIHSKQFAPLQTTPNGFFFVLGPVNVTADPEKLVPLVFSFSSVFFSPQASSRQIDTCSSKTVT